MQMELDLTRDEAILDWLGGNSHSLRHSEFCDTKQEDTGRWFLDSVEFRSWLDAEGETLFCWGAPGAGKSMLTCIAVSHLTSMGSASKAGIGYIYLDYVRQEEQSIRVLMAEILRQLAYADGTVDECVKSLYRNRGKNATPSREELQHALETSIAKFYRTFLIVDALDEGTPKCRKDLVSTLLLLQQQFKVNIFVTSMKDPKILELFDGHNKVLCKEIVGPSEGFGRYLDFELVSLPQGRLIEHQD
jgi:hypothetical protein